jgi:hypothetical protein
MNAEFAAIRQELILAARRGEAAQASSLIPGYLDALERSMQALSSEEVQAVEAFLPALLEAQSEADWVRFADLLERSAG